MDTSRHIRSLLTALAVLLLAACAADDSNSPEQSGSTFHLLASSRSYDEMAAMTRFSVGSGDNAVEYNPMATPGASIRVYITTSSRLDFYGDFVYDREQEADAYSWTKRVPLDNDTYYIYGFMPSTASLVNSTTIAPYNSSYASGARMTIGNAPAMMTEDFCAIVGVKRASSLTADIASAGMERGNYRYVVERTNDDNYAFLLLDHLYACLRFTMAVNADYARLRTIHLKEFSIVPAATRYNIQANMLGGYATTLNATFTPTSGTSVGEQSLWKGSSEMDLTLNKTTDERPTPLYGADFQDIYIAPHGSNSSFTITSRYDVYDHKGNLIRKDCEATNMLSLSGLRDGGMRSGDRYTIPLIVSPTYLYVLSEPDLDNPTITLGEE